MSHPSLLEYHNRHLSAEDSPARMSVALVSERGLTEAEPDSGLNSSESLITSDPLGSLERMLKDSLPKDSTKCLAVWKQQTTPASRIVFLLARLARRTKGIGSSLLLTPTATQTDPTTERFEKRTAYRESIGRHWVAGCLAEQVAMIPTITCNTGKNTSPGINFDMREKKRHLDGVFMNQIGKPNGLMLQPAFAEWMQGFPEGWTDLPALEMPSSRSRSTRSSKQSQTLKEE
jgi:hypothetical protein